MARFPIRAWPRLFTKSIDYRLANKVLALILIRCGLAYIQTEREREMNQYCEVTGLL